jgi:hypothetical protein
VVTCEVFYVWFRGLTRSTSSTIAYNIGGREKWEDLCPRYKAPKKLKNHVPLNSCQPSFPDNLRSHPNSGIQTMSTYLSLEVEIWKVLTR